MRLIHRRGIVSVLIIIVALLTGLLGCDSPSPSEPPQDPELNPFMTSMAAPVVRRTNEFVDDSVTHCLKSWFHAWATSRVIPVQIEQRDPLVFGPWQGEAEYGTTDANADGKLTEWQDHYYIVHDWAPIGQQILSLIPGDVVEVNGRPVRIQTVFNYPKDSYYDEILEVVGTDTVVFQTCYPNSDENRIACGI